MVLKLENNMCQVNNLALTSPSHWVSPGVWEQSHGSGQREAWWPLTMCRAELLAQCSASGQRLKPSQLCSLARSEQSWLSVFPFRLKVLEAPIHVTQGSHDVGSREPQCHLWRSRVNVHSASMLPSDYIFSETLWLRLFLREMFRKDGAQLILCSGIRYNTTYN